jgi:deferrochelatase/peroxidase EfeB
MMTSERLGAIAINKNSVPLNDSWTINGTYLAFIRIAIDLDIWDKIARKYQERIVGRDKITGCPLIGVDKNDNNILMRGCPIPGTFEVVEKGNETFRTHPPYGDQKNLHGISDLTLTQSHIGRAYKIDKVPSWDKRSSRIFRQGYDFLESINTSPFIRAGLNFMSFQGSTRRLSGILKYGLGKINFGGDPEKPFFSENKLLSVRAAGMFLVPPYDERDAFPGQKIFWGDQNISNLSLKNKLTDY